MITALSHRMQGLLRPFSSNPVVTRDLRVQLRGTRPYILLGVYLLLLGILAVAGYNEAAKSTDGNGAGIVQMQSKLQGFYNFIFFTLATLISLIAPALTASTITSEKQRQTLDLLVTTPLSAMELLLGKLISSISFIALLLFLSLPASALCVLLGGATIWDVFQVYLILAIDGLLMSAIGLFYSCTARNSLEGLSWTYTTIFVLLVCSSPLSALAFSGIPGSSITGGSPIFSVAALNPFIAVLIGGKSFAVGGVPVPTFVGTAILSFLAIRMLVTGATFRMGRFGLYALASLRRQILFLTAIGTFLTFFAAGKMGSFGTASPLFGFLILSFLFGLPFYPSLFTPVVPEDSEPGTVLVGSYRPKNMFNTAHSGTLPYFHLWLAVFMITAFVGIMTGTSWTGIAGATVTSFSPVTPGGGTSISANPYDSLLLVPATAFYLSGLGFLMWGIARRASTLVVGMSAARALSFGLYILIGALPLMLMAMSRMNWEDNYLRYFWLLYPITETTTKSITLNISYLMLLYGLYAYILGVVAYPPWRSVIPASPRYKPTKPTESDPIPFETVRGVSDANR